MSGVDLRIRALNADDGDALQALCEACVDYYEEITGLPPGPAEAQGLFIAAPEGVGYEAKLLLGLLVGDNLAGVVDIIQNYPAPEEWRIGLLMLHPQQRRHGLGRAAVESIRAQAAAAGVRRLSLGVKSAYAPACAFWRACGFETVEKKVLTLRGGTAFDIMARAVTSGIL